ncbi:MAG: diacylglycerol/lipid kinase family protein [Armatimonadota bacterium]
MSNPEDLTRQIRTDRTAVLVINTCSRKGQQFFVRAKQALEQRGIILADAHAVRDPGQLPRIIRESIGGGHRLIIVGGGDGTISSIAGLFAYQDVVLGLLPLGTGNSFAKTMSIPLDLDKAIDVICTGKVIKISLGKVDNTYFTNFADIGMSVIAAQATPGGLKRFLGKLAYVVTGAGEVLRHRPFQCILRVGDQQQTFSTHELIIANGRYYGDTRLPAGASVLSDKLVIVSIDTPNPWRLLQVWTTLLRGNRKVFAELRRLAAEEIHIDTDPPQPIDLDGEVKRDTPATFSVAPQAMNILVPEGF